MLMVACLLITSGESGESVETSNRERSCTARPDDAGPAPSEPVVAITLLSFQVYLFPKRNQISSESATCPPASNGEKEAKVRMPLKILLEFNTK